MKPFKRIISVVLCVVISFCLCFGTYADDYVSDISFWEWQLIHAIQYGGYTQYRIPVFLLDESKKYCQMVENIRNNDGYYTEVMDKFLLLDMLGYNVNPAAIEETKVQDRILHSDGKTYDYKNIPTEKDRK